MNLVKRLSSAYRKDQGSNLYKLMLAISQELDEIEQAIEQVRDSHFVELASGKSLDMLAKIFNIKRSAGESDEDLRGRLQVELQRYLSSGTLSDIRNVIEYFTGLQPGEYELLEAPGARLGFGEASYGNNLYGTAKLTFRIIMRKEPEKLNIKAFYQAINAVRMAGVYFQEACTEFWFYSPQPRAAGSSLIYHRPQLPLGYGDAKFGERGYGEAHGPKAVAQAALDISVGTYPQARCECSSGGVFEGIGGYAYGSYGNGYYGHGGA